MLESLETACKHVPVKHKNQGKAATPPEAGWSGTGRGQEGDQERPGSSKGSQIAATEDCRSHSGGRWWQGKAARRAWKVPHKPGLSLLSCSLPATPQPGSSLGEGETLGTRVEAAERRSCSPLFLRGDCLNPVIPGPGPKASRVNALHGEQ